MEPDCYLLVRLGMMNVMHSQMMSHHNYLMIDDSEQGIAAAEVDIQVC